MRRSAPRPLSAVLETVAHRAAPPGLLAQVQAAWPEVVGRTIAEEAEPISAREDTVTVGCRSATWAHELELLSGDLTDRLNAHLGVDSVRCLRFVVRNS